MSLHTPSLPALTPFSPPVLGVGVGVALQVVPW